MKATNKNTSVRSSERERRDVEDDSNSVAEVSLAWLGIGGGGGERRRRFRGWGANISWQKQQQQWRRIDTLGPIVTTAGEYLLYGKL